MMLSNKFMKKSLPNNISKNGLFEKSEMKWFSKHDIKNNISKFRPHYKDIALQLLKI